jgi:hypothetical protein
VAACTDSPTGTLGERELPDGLSCSIPESEIFIGQFRDAIPALTDPEMDFFGAPGTEQYSLDDRVVGVFVGDQPVAVPLNIFWWHEIVNLSMNGESLAITHCPLTGSSLTFDRAPQGGVEFGVSGLLYRNNLIMYDRTEGAESLWPQMARGGRCGPADGTELQMVGATEMTLDGWRRLHGNTLIVTTNTGWDRDYGSEFYPYGQYDDPDNEQLLFTVSEPIDRRHPPKERALGVPSQNGTGGLAFVYETLRSLGPKAAIGEEVDGEPFVVFWDEEKEGAMAYRPTVEGEVLTFELVENKFVDTQTGSTWNTGGIATGGPLAGSALEPVHEAFVAFWFAWPLFYADIESWRPS